jgi:arginyl-tRNA synthetase
MSTTKAEQLILNSLKQALTKLNYYQPGKVELKLEQPKIEEHGDFSTNIAMQLTSLAKKAPHAIAQEIVDSLASDNQLIEKCEIAGPGFINFYLGWGYYRQLIKEILNSDANYGTCEWGRGVRVQVEFVSANPTGPLNIVSARAAAVGDVVTNLFNMIGYQADREYYINDAGRQIRLLGQSVSSHYMNYFNQSEEFPEEGYRGEYVKDLAHQIAQDEGDRFTKITPKERYEALAKIALKKMVLSHQAMMELYRVHYQNWFSETSLRESNEQQKVLDLLKSKGYLYENDGALWFQSTQFGDDKDRVLITSEGEPTYFLIDIAYHKNKYDRGYQILYNFLGPDHHGYIARMKAALKALGYEEKSFNVELIQQVNLFRGGEVVKMSKRAGQIIEMAELVEEVGVDAARFFFVNRKISSHLDFDIDLAKKQSDENPVYYLQYAHARICSILRYALEQGIDLAQDCDLNLIKENEERDLIKSLAKFPEMILKAATSLETHLLTNYLKDVAAFFHRFYHVHRVVTDDRQLSLARLALANATRIVLANGFKILGISAPEKM